MNNLVFGLIAVIALFAFFKLAKVKASSKQLNRNNRINRFGNSANKNGNIIQKFLDMVKGECDSKNEKVKSYTKELNYYLDILYKFTGWIEDKTKIEKPNTIVIDVLSIATPTVEWHFFKVLL